MRPPLSSYCAQLFGKNAPSFPSSGQGVRCAGLHRERCARLSSAFSCSPSRVAKWLCIGWRIFIYFVARVLTSSHVSSQGLPPGGLFETPRKRCGHPQPPFVFAATRLSDCGELRGTNSFLVSSCLDSCFAAEAKSSAQLLPYNISNRGNMHIPNLQCKASIEGESARDDCRRRL